MKVYLLFTGTYEDITVANVYATEELAQEALDRERYYAGEIEEYEVIGAEGL